MSSERESGSRVRGRRGDGSIRRTKSGTFEYRISYTDEYGQSRSKSFSNETIDGCVDRAEKFRMELRFGARSIKADMTISEILRNKARIDLEKNHTGEQG